jgi:hypothetical protein
MDKRTPGYQAPPMLVAPAPLRPPVGQWLTLRSLASIGAVTAICLTGHVEGTWAILVIAGISIPSVGRNLVEVAAAARGANPR